MKERFFVEEEGQRLDKFLSSELPELSRVTIQKLIKDGQILLNNQNCSCSTIVALEDEIVINIPSFEENELLAEPMKVKVVYEDEWILIIDKPANLVVHPGSGNLQGTLVNQLLGYNEEVFSAMLDENQRPGIVHRLDKDTTGLMVIAKSSLIEGKLKSAFQGKNIKKDYLALVFGALNERDGEIDTLYGRHPKDRKKMAVLEEAGKEALTLYRTLASHRGVSLLQVRLETGRTHQIRVHFNHLGNPLLGDKTYGTKNIQELAPRQMLHAWRLNFYHPETKEKLSFESDIPQDLKDCAIKYNINLG